MLFSLENLNIEMLGAFCFNKTEYSNIQHCIKRPFETITIRAEGSSKISIRNEEFYLKKNDIVYLPKGSSYIRSTKGETIYGVNFLLNRYTSITPEMLTPNNPEKCIGLFKEINDTWKEQKVGYRYKCSSLFYILLEELHKQVYTSHNIKNPALRIQSSIDYINENFMKNDITVKYLADLSGVSEVYYRRLFTKLLGVSPIKYINNLRMEYGAKLLQFGEYNICEVAEILGFSDPKYFSTTFKRTFNITPSDYIKTRSNHF